jgi:hypothetical protein
MQLIVMLLAMVRFFLIGLMEIGNFINLIAGTSSNETVQVQIFSLIVFG